MAAPALAWDVEDPCVADSDDFILGRSIDYDTDPPTSEWHWGGDGYNLYRDDASDTGDLDYVAIGFTAHNFFRHESPNTYYWATEPRGRDFTKAEILEGSGVPGKGLGEAPGLDKEFNPKSKAADHAGKK